MSIDEYQLNKLKSELFDKALESFVILDKDLRLIDVSSNVIKNLGLIKQDVIGKRIEEFNPGIEKTDRYRAYVEVLETGKSKVLEEIRQHPKLGQIAARIKIFKVGDGLGLATLDVSDLMSSIQKLEKTKKKLKKANTELAKKNTELEEVSYIAAHDLKAPTTNLNSLIEILKNKEPLSGDGQLIVDKMETVLMNVQKKLKALNEIIHIKSMTDAKKNDVSFEEIVQTVKDENSEKIQARQCSITTDFKKCPTVRYNTFQLQTVIQNILINAIKHTFEERKPEIHIVSYTQKNKKTVLSISDNGVGFKNDTPKDKLFGLFQRLNTNVDGLGLGLYIVNSIVTSNGGRITFESTPGKGTTFNIFL